MEYMQFTDLNQPSDYERTSATAKENGYAFAHETAAFLNGAKALPSIDNMHLFNDHEYQLLTNLGQNFTQDFNPTAHPLSTTTPAGGFQQVCKSSFFASVFHKHFSG